MRATKAPEGAAAGAVGALVGGTLGWLAGIGALAIGRRPAHRRRSDCRRAGRRRRGRRARRHHRRAGRTSHSCYEAKRYEGRVRKGGILLSVHADDSQWAKRGREVLNETGAEDISSTSEVKGDFANFDRPKALP